jgi:hypothetical protein
MNKVVKVGGGGYQVDVVGSPALEVQEYIRKLLNGIKFPLKKMGKGIILTEYAFQWAAGEKDRAGAAGAGHGWFFAPMDIERGNLYILAGAAYAGFVLFSFCTALPGAQRTWTITLFKKFLEVSEPFYKKVLTRRRQII